MKYKNKAGRGQTSISIDMDVLESMREAELPMSQLAEEAFKAALCADALKSDIQRQQDALSAKLIAVTERESAAAREKETAIAEFKKLMNPTLFDNPAAVIYWSKRTGLAPDRLRELKSEPFDNQK